VLANFLHFSLCSSLGKGTVFARLVDSTSHEITECVEGKVKLWEEGRRGSYITVLMMGCSEIH